MKCLRTSSTGNVCVDIVLNENGAYKVTILFGMLAKFR